jgi:glycosidase
MNHWAWNAFFYHIYPLGLCGAPKCNDFQSPAVNRLEQLYSWLDHIQSLGANAVYLGPLFESSAHGYDTVDYYHVDRRLGGNEILARLSGEVHRRGMRLVLDAVFNHVGRDFWAFYDLRQNGAHSAYRDWFHNLRFGGCSPYGDPFQYESWNGHYSLVKLNLQNPAVREHLLGAVRMWVEQFGVDGLRLDAADCIDLDFLTELADFGKRLRTDFWLMGEVIHGDYRRWVNPQVLDSVTNYESYKGLYSSHNDRNYFEIAYALKRQFSEEGIYADLPLYNFADNHDVNRVASALIHQEHLYPLYALLFTMPGVPSIYYGSEWGMEGERTPQDDSALRPVLTPGQFEDIPSARNLEDWIRRLAHIRQAVPALRYGGYRQLHVSSEQLVFLREFQGRQALIALNASASPVQLSIKLPSAVDSAMVDLLNPGDHYFSRAGRMVLENVPPRGARILSTET